MTKHNRTERERQYGIPGRKKRIDKKSITNKAQTGRVLSRSVIIPMFASNEKAKTIPVVTINPVESRRNIMMLNARTASNLTLGSQATSSLDTAGKEKVMTILDQLLSPLLLILFTYYS
jgi:hypothetical protein